MISFYRCYLSLSLEQIEGGIRLARKSGNKKGEIEVCRHDDTRKNAVPVRLASYDTSKLKPKKYVYDPHLDPQLVWAGKAEHTSFEVLTVSFHIHKRINNGAETVEIKRQEKGAQLTMPGIKGETNADLKLQQLGWKGENLAEVCVKFGI